MPLPVELLRFLEGGAAAYRHGEDPASSISGPSVTISARSTKDGN
jgi:hypothetical protein